MTRTAKIRAEKETDPAELRRLVNWFKGIADDYRSARLGAVDDKDIVKDGGALAPRVRSPQEV